MIVPRSRLLWTIALGALPVLTIAALLPGAEPAAWGAVALLGAVTLADALLSRRLLAGLRVQLPELLRLAKDREAIVPVHVMNDSSAERLVRLGFSFPDSLQPAEEDRWVRVPAGRSRVDWPCTPRERGHFALDPCYLEVNSPLGFWAVRGHTPAPGELRVYPHLQQERKQLAALRQGRLGATQQRQVGKGREFEKLREYAPGDSYDEIHWKTTAKRGHPITKVFQVERTQEVYVVLDSSRLTARPAGGTTTLERYIQAALFVGYAAEEQGDLFGLVTFSDAPHGFVRARNGKVQYAACRDALTSLKSSPVSPDYDELATFLRLRLRRRALLLFLTELDDPAHAAAFTRAARLLSGQHLVLANMVRPAEAQPLFQERSVETVDDVYTQLGHHLQWQSLRELELALKRDGVRLTLHDPETLGMRLALLYQEIKQRQLL